MSAQEPLVSVIIPVYNTAAYVKQTIESVLAQTWANKEIIVVNDGSTDETPSILIQFGNSIQVIHQENKGLGAARNTGIRAAQGDLIAFIDADDLWEPEFLETQVTALTSNPDVDIVYCWWSYIDQYGNQLPQQDRFSKSGDLLQTLITSNRIPIMATLLRRKCVETTKGFDEDKLIIEDWDFWLRVAYQGYRFICTPKKLVKYRFHRNNMTLNIERSPLCYLNVIEKFFSNENLPEFAKELRAEVYGQVFLNTTLNYLSCDNLEKANEYFVESIKYCPALIFQVDTYYRIICSSQPYGYKDTKEYLNLDHSEHQINQLIEAIFNESTVPGNKTISKRRAYATAQSTLAEFYYKESRYDVSRKLLKLAIRNYPFILFSRQTILLLVKAYLGQDKITNLKRFVYKLCR